MSADDPTSPDDPDWVDAIVARALERSKAAPAASEDEPPPVITVETTPKVATRRDAPPTEPRRRMPPPREPVAPAPDIFAPEPTPRPEPVRPSTSLSPGPVVDSQAATDDALAGLAPQGGRSRTPYPDDELFVQATGAADGDDADGYDGAVSARMRGFLEWGAVIVGALAVALLIKTFLMQAYFIPSPSMEPTLGVGDRLLVNKLSYEFGDIGRGDLVVFNRPPNARSGEDDLIKRVIGLPGETLEIVNGEILITPAGTDEPQRLNEPYLPEGVTTSSSFFQAALDRCAASTATSCTVPEGHVFVMGDNRGNSSDSRQFGPIDDELVVGRAFLRVWPLSDISFL